VCFILCWYFVHAAMLSLAEVNYTCMLIFLFKYNGRGLLHVLDSEYLGNPAKSYGLTHRNLVISSGQQPVNWSALLPNLSMLLGAKKWHYWREVFKWNTCRFLTARSTTPKTWFLFLQFLRFRVTDQGNSVWNLPHWNSFNYLLVKRSVRIQRASDRNKYKGNRVPVLITSFC
jgi:hypothetical protein